MSFNKSRWTLFIIFACLFLFIAPITNDFYNTQNIRTFLNVLFINKYLNQDLASIHAGFQNYSWPVDWPYPPLTILLTLPSWVVFRITDGNEFIYQFVFKLPMLMATLTTAFLIFKCTRDARNVKSYLFNPGVVLLTIVWGGFDAVTGFLLISAFLLWKKRNYMGFSLLLSLAISLRIYPIVLLPFALIHFLRKKDLKNTAKFLFLSLTIPAISFFASRALFGDIIVESLVNQQKEFGPFGIYPLFYGITILLNNLGLFYTDPKIIPIGLVATTFFTLSYLLVKTAGKLRIPDIFVLGLLIFFLFYPKMHSLYIMALFPIAFIDKRWEQLKYVWVPGTLWSLLVNGHDDVRGIFYWFYWLSKLKFTLFENVNIGLTLMFSLTQELTILYLILTFVKKIKLASKP